MTTRPSPLLLAWLALLALGAAVIYLPGLGNLPIFDDDYLASGDLLREYGSLLPIKQRLLSYGSFVWVHAALGDGWWKQRLVNLLLHAATVAAVWAFWREVLAGIAVPREPGGDATALPAESAAFRLGMLAFALNPVAVYAVAYLVERSIVMATMFTAVALWTLVRGLRTSRPGWFALSLVAYVAAVASKEQAILAPLAAVPVYVVVARPRPARLALLGVVGLAAMAATGLFLRSRFGEIIGTPIDEYSRVYLAQLARIEPSAPAQAWPLSIENQAWLFFGYGLRWMLPWSGWMSINLRPPFPLTLTTFPQVLGIAGYLGVIATGAWLVIRHRDWRAVLGLALLLPALLFATEFAIVWVQDPFVLYRSYLWAIGVPALVFALFNGLSSRAGIVVGIVVAGLFAWQGLDRVLSMDTPERAWTDAIAKLPDDPRSVGRWFPYLNRGAGYVDRDELALALRDFQSSEALGDMGMGAFNAGSVLAAQGKHAEAVAAFARAAEQGYTPDTFQVLRAQSLVALGRPDQAWEALLAARRIGPPSPTRERMLLELGKVGLQLGHFEEAIDALQELVRRDPRNPEARYLLAMAYLRTQRIDRALPLFDALVAENANGAAYYGRALAHYALKHRAQALADIGEAERRDPRNAMLREWEAKIRALPGS